jgi:hypothetical protein
MDGDSLMVTFPLFGGYRVLLRHNSQSFYPLGLETNEAAL